MRARSSHVHQLLRQTKQKTLKNTALNNSEVCAAFWCVPKLPSRAATSSTGRREHPGVLLCSEPKHHAVEQHWKLTVTLHRTSAAPSPDLTDSACKRVRRSLGAQLGETKSAGGRKGTLAVLVFETPVFSIQTYPPHICATSRTHFADRCSARTCKVLCDLYSVSKATICIAM